VKRDPDIMRDWLLRLEAESELWVRVAVTYSDSFGNQQTDWFTERSTASDGDDIFDVKTERTRISDEEYASLMFLKDALFVELAVHSNDYSGDPDELSETYVRITNAGHDYLDSIRDPEVWRKTKQAAAKAGGFTLDVLSDVAKSIISGALIGLLKT